jgi:uncharacterized protein YqgC (DUF456 family)
MAVLLTIFVILVLMGVGFSFIPVLPGPPFAILGIMLIPLWPELAGRVDDLSWWVAGSLAMLGLVITVVDIASPYLAKLYEGVLGKSSRPAAIGAAVGLFLGVVLSLISACSGVAIPVLAALPLPLVLITPFVGAMAGEASVTGPMAESPKARMGRIVRSAFVQWLGLLTTILLKAGYCMLVLPVGVWMIIRMW